MSAKAGTIQGTRRGVSWTGAWIAALLLTAILALSLFAVNRSSGGVERAPATATFEITNGHEWAEQGRTEARQGVQPGGQGIVIGSYVCHQCR